MPDFSQHAAAIVALLGAVGCLLWIYNQIRIAMGKSRAPQPFVVAMERKFTSREDHDELRRVVIANKRDADNRFLAQSQASSESREKIYNLIRDMDAKSEERAEKTHQRLNIFGEQLAASRSSEQHATAMLSRMDTKIDKLNERKADKST